MGWGNVVGSRGGVDGEWVSGVEQIISEWGVQWRVQWRVIEQIGVQWWVMVEMTVGGSDNG